MWKIFVILFISGFSFSLGEEDSIAAFRKLSVLNEEWLKKTSFPEAAILLQHPPYSYHATTKLLDISKQLVNNKSSIKMSHADSQNGHCSDDLLQIITNLKSEWALQMLDSDGKLDSGVLRGSITWPGHFEECLSTYAPKDQDGHGDFHGQYCLTSWKMNLGGKYPNLPLTIGLCVPDSCSEENLLVFGQNIIHNFDRVPVLKDYAWRLNLTNVSCKTKAHSLDTATIIYLIFIFTFIFSTVIGSAITILDWKQSANLRAIESSLASLTIPTTTCTEEISHLSEALAKEDNKKATHMSSPSDISTDDKVPLTENQINFSTAPKTVKKVDSVLKRIFLCFSVFSNGEKILNTQSSEGQLLSLHGVRFLSLTWVILGHTYITSIHVIGNRIDVLKEMDSFAFQVLLQAPFSVDSFFLLSGFLLSYLFLKEINKKNGKMNWIYFYVHRLWRLTPAYMVAVFFYMLVFKYIGSGPFWEDNHCDELRGTWWKYLLYINNFIPIHKMCVGWSWYLANDMQFYIISPIFLYSLWRWPIIGMSLLMAALIGTWTTTATLCSLYDVIPMFVGVTQAKDFDAYAEKMWDSFDLIYDKPYSRIAPYLIGIFLGFVLHKFSGKKGFLAWWHQIIGWTFATFCSLSVVYGLYHIEMSKTTAIIYNTLCRSSFTAGLAWLIFACETGHGGFIAKILSWKFWMPLSRLTYSAYLVHPILIHAYYQAFQTAFHFTELVMVTNFMGFLLMSYGLALVFSLTFESPLMNIEKLLLKTKSTH